MNIRFEVAYRMLVVRLGHHQAIWAIAHRLCRLTWKILQEGVSYIEKGTRPNPRAVRKCAHRLLRDLRALGYQVQVTPAPGDGATMRLLGEWVFDRAPMAIGWSEPFPGGTYPL